MGQELVTIETFLRNKSVLLYEDTLVLKFLKIVCVNFREHLYKIAPLNNVMQFNIAEKCNTVLHLFYSASIAKIAGKLFIRSDTEVK